MLDFYCETANKCLYRLPVSVVRSGTTEMIELSTLTVIKYIKTGLIVTNGMREGIYEH